ncbi:putative transcriptional regulator YtfH [Escherichia coli]|nr:putative transcriptional regulator YtfH [Escherichia coli]
MSQVSLSQQLKEGNLFAEQCPSREVLKHVTSRWGVLILVALREGTHRFSDLRRKIGGVSEKMLAQSLQALEQDGFLNRIAYPVVPPHVEYSLTPLGEQVSEKVAALADWIELNLPEVLACGMNVRHNCRLRLSGLRFMTCRADKMRQHRIRQKCRMRLMIYRPKKKCITYSNPPDKSQTRYHRSRLYSSDIALSL